jgi:light-regulated signal transduction histidine kinase (bacteriophytochrome)
MIHAARRSAASVDLGAAFEHELRPESRSSTDIELGARVARRLIELHGGSLWTDTTDAAVTLAFHLPLVDEGC